MRMLVITLTLFIVITCDFPLKIHLEKCDLEIEVQKDKKLF